MNAKDIAKDSLSQSRSMKKEKILNIFWKGQEHTEAMTLFSTSESHLDSYHRREIEC